MISAFFGNIEQNCLSDVENMTNNKIDLSFELIETTNILSLIHTALLIKNESKIYQPKNSEIAISPNSNFSNLTHFYFNDISQLRRENLELNEKIIEKKHECSILSFKKDICLYLALIINIVIIILSYNHELKKED